MKGTTLNKCCHYCGYPPQENDEELRTCPACGAANPWEGKPMVVRGGRRGYVTLDNIEQTGAYFG